MNRTTRGILTLTLACGIAGTTAWSKPDAEASARKGNFDQPLAQGDSHVTASVTQIINGERFTLRLEDGERTVEHNGKVVPPERLKEHNGSIDVIGEDGKTILATFGVSKLGVWAGDRARALELGADRMPRGLRAAPRAVVVDNPPPVMLGITMSDTDEGGIKVEMVAPGLPAAEAGVKSGDEIVKIDGRNVLTPIQLREVMMTLKPGQVVDLGIRREGVEETLKLKLSEFDRERLAISIPEGGQDEPLTKFFYSDPRQEADYKRAIERIKRAMEEVAKSEKLESAKEAANQALEKALAAVEDAHQRAMSEWKALAADPNLMPRVFTPRGDLFQISPVEPPAAPQAPGVGDAQLESRLKRLTSILEKLDARLEKLEKKLEDRP